MPAGIDPSSLHRARPAALALLLLPLSFAGCHQQAAPPPPQLPPPAVVAVPARSAVIEEAADFVGRVVAIERVELRARVEGFLKERRFTEGQEVAVGDLLFLIEPDRYQSIVAQRKADVAKAKADAKNAAAQLARGLELLKANNIPQARVDELQAAAVVSEATIAQTEAALAAAELDLSYTRITAPVAGRIGLSRLSVGNLVGPTSGVLATIVSRDPVYVEFPVTQRELLEARRAIQARGGNPEDYLVKARLPDGSLYEPGGHLDFVDVTTNQSTDSVTVRAELPNPNGLLVDGQYVGVVAMSGDAEPRILVPQSALQIDQQGSFVVIIDAESKAQIRRIETGPSKGAEVVVTQGLSAGELVISEGAQKTRPGQLVKPAPAQHPETETAR